MFHFLRGAHGHFEGELPWANCDEPLRPAMAKIVGKYLFLSNFGFIYFFVYKKIIY